MKELEIVRVIQLPTGWSNDASGPNARDPQVGDIGTIVHVNDAHNFIVECVRPDGVTIWLGDFHESELVLVNR